MKSCPHCHRLTATAHWCPTKGRNIYWQELQGTRFEEPPPKPRMKMVLDDGVDDEFLEALKAANKEAA